MAKHFDLEVEDPLLFLLLRPVTTNSCPECFALVNNLSHCIMTDFRLWPYIHRPYNHKDGQQK